MHILRRTPNVTHRSYTAHMRLTTQRRWHSMPSAASSPSLNTRDRV